MDNISEHIVPAYVYLDFARGVRYPDDSFYYSGNRKTLESIKIPDGIGIIHESGLSCCTKLKTVEIPDSVYLIDEAAFYGCRSLRDFHWPQNLTKIGLYAFYGCSFNDYTLPQSLLEIGSNAFNKNLELIKVPDSLEKCSSHAFGTYTKSVEVLLRNPCYKMIDNCMINTKNQSVLFRNPRSKKRSN